METISHSIRDLNSAERSAAERLVGHALDENQRLLIHVVSEPAAVESDATQPDDGELSDWCNVYAGLSDERIAALEQAISRRLDLSRS